MSLEQARTGLAASHVGDPDTQALYLAAARVMFDRARRDLDAFEAVLVARERELVRAKHGDAEQLALGASK